jgi:hypothetical protein
MRVYLDEHGRPTVPPRDAHHVAAPSTSRAVSADEEPLIELDAPGGGTMVRLGDRFRSYSVARLGADGRLTIECVGSEHRHAQRGTGAGAPGHGQSPAESQSAAAGAVAAPKDVLLPQDRETGDTQ